MKMNYEQAKKALLNGKVIYANEITSETTTRLRFWARRLEKELADSGIFSYRHYFLKEPFKFPQI